MTHVIRRGVGDYRIPYPVPRVLRCGFCLNKRGGQWRTEERVRVARAHFRENHDDEAFLDFTFFCEGCGLEGSKHRVGRHKCGETLLPLEPDNEVVPNKVYDEAGIAESWVRGNQLILLYPGQATRCPLEDCDDQFVTVDTMCGTMDKMHRHMDVDHGMRLKKFWRCSICSFEGNGYKLASHFKKCTPALPSPPLLATPEAAESSYPRPVAASPVPSSPFTITPQSVAAGQSETSGLIPLMTPPLLSGEQLLDMDDPAVFDLPPDIAESPLLPEPGVDGTPIFSLQRRNREEGQLTPQSFQSYEAEVAVPPAHGGRSQDFFRLWSGAFLDCQVAEDFDSVLARCCSDWLEKASTAERELPELASSRNPLRGGRRRNQCRQQQRIRRQAKFDSINASRIQKLFKIYPRRAVREVLGEQSPRYSGTVEDAGLFLKNTYSRQPPTNEQCQQSRELFEQCSWSLPSEDQRDFLDQPPSRAEIELKLKRATNTSPGMDGLEYRHLRALDPKGYLLEIVFCTTWRIGIPEAWRMSRTVPIFKKGDTSDYSNFRPISLLPTMYKIFSGILSQRLCSVAADLEWLSPEQKGFLPGVHGIQEHTQLLQTAIEETKFSKGDLMISWLDLSNAFGSIPHAVLNELFGTLPVPNHLKRLLLDIYSDNKMDFVVGKESIRIAPMAGVRQGDALSTTVFNLSSEPLLRAAKSAINPGFSIFGSRIKATAYADDIAVVCNGVEGLQNTLDDLSIIAEILGLKFNANKCACLAFTKGKHSTEALSIGGNPIRSLGPDDHEIYLGTPIGSKLTFRPANQLVPHIDKVADSLLAPWQKLEVFRSHLLPSLSHHLASGRVLKASLTKLDTECRKFLGHVAEVPGSATIPFFYADRKVGGLGMFRLGDDADIWTIARATQLLSSKDETVRSICRNQLDETVKRACQGSVPDPFLRSEFLSRVTTGGMYRVRYGNNRVSNLWQNARKAAGRLRLRIDVSGEFNIRIIADDVSALPVKAIRGLRMVVRQRWTKKLLAVTVQGRVATGLELDSSSKDMARLVSCRTELRIADWKYLHCARLDLLPLRGVSWSQYDTKTCRRCNKEETVENTFHVINNCVNGLHLATVRHDSVLALLEKLLLKKGLTVTINRAPPGQRLRPDLETTLSGSRVMIDVAVSFDTPNCLLAAHTRKVEKYMTLGNILPLVVGSLGSWYPRNEEIRSFLGIDSHSWSTFRRNARTAALHGSMDMIRDHLGRGNPTTNVLCTSRGSELSLVETVEIRTG